MRSGPLILTWILLVCMSKVPVQSQHYSQSRAYDPKAMKVTDLHFFLHEKFAGENPTAAVVAQANITSNDDNNSSWRFRFGDVYVIDDSLKIGPDESSEVIGNAQGLAVFSDKNATMVVVYYDFGFTSGKFNGSSISIFSRNPVTEMEQRELAVVGGRGKFRMAKGFAKLKTLFRNETNLIVDYKVTIVHYGDDDDHY